MNEKYREVAVVLACIAILASVLVVGVGPSGIIGLSSATPTPSQNQTASVVFTNQTTNGTSVTIRSVTLSEGGFVVIHGPAYANNGVISGSAITVSRYLSAGTHENVTIQFSNGIPGAISNISNFSGVYGALSAVVYQDTNGNHHFDYIESFGQNDTPYRGDGTRVDDKAYIITQQQLNQPRQPTATITFTNQTITNGTLTVKRVSLSDGGFVVVHNASYLPPSRNPFSSAIGLSRYLEPGVHRNVTVHLLDKPINRSQTVVAVVYQDTNNDQSYDYITSDGAADYAYTTNQSIENSTIVTDIAYLSLSSEPTPTPVQIPSSNASTSPETPVTQTPSDQPTAEGESGGILSGMPIWQIGLLIIVVLIIILAFMSLSIYLILRNVLINGAELEGSPNLKGLFAASSYYQALLFSRFAYLK